MIGGRLKKNLFSGGTQKNAADYQNMGSHIDW